MAKKQKTTLSISTPILYILLGILLVVFRSQTLNWAMTFAGAVFVISGIVDLCKRHTLSGTVSLVVGILILVLGWAAAKIVLLVLGVLIVVKGLVGFFDVFKLPKKRRTFLRFLFPILTVVVGLGLAFGNGLDIAILVVGVLLIVDGILGLVGSK